MDAKCGQKSTAIDVASDNDIKGVLEGNETATDNFVREHIFWMLVVARRILRDEARAEDAVQIAFTNIFKKLLTFEGRSALKTWMHRVVVNQALMMLRGDRRLKEMSIDHLLPEFDERGCRIEAPWTSSETPESLLQQSETKVVVIDAINQLPEKFRIVLLLREIEELTTIEVAELLKLSESNVKVRLHRARAALKTVLEPLIRNGLL